jgi:transcription initiation factor TFIID subunit 10
MSDPESMTTGHEQAAPAETVNQTSGTEAIQPPSTVNGTAEAGPSTTPAEPSNPPNGDVEMNGSTPPNEPNGDQDPKTAEAEADEPDLSQLFAARREEELARRDRSLAEFLVMLDGYKPLVRGGLPRGRCFGDKMTLY